MSNILFKKKYWFINSYVIVYARDEQPIFHHGVEKTCYGITVSNKYQNFKKECSVREISFYIKHMNQEYNGDIKLLKDSIHHELLHLLLSNTYFSILKGTPFKSPDNEIDTIEHDIIYSISEFMDEYHKLSVNIFNDIKKFFKTKKKRRNN